MRTGPALAALATLLLAGCGGAPGELLTVSTSGGGGDNHRFVVTGDGRGRCDGGGLRTLPSSHVLDAREVERELKDPAKQRASYMSGPAGARRYVYSTNDGLVSFVEGARGAPPVVPKAIALVQELKSDLCPGPESSGP
jgi:hypothetical protein